MANTVGSEIPLKLISDVVITETTRALPILANITTVLDNDAAPHSVLAVRTLQTGVSTWDETEGYWTVNSAAAERILRFTEHPISGIAISDGEEANEGFIGIMEDFTKSAARKLAASFATKFNAVLNAATPVKEFTMGAAGAKVDDVGLLELAKLAQDIGSFTIGEGSSARQYDNDPGNCALCVSRDLYARILSLVGANIIGTGEYIKTGYIPGLCGFAAVVAMDLPAGEVCRVVPKQAIICASRSYKPATGGLVAYAEQRNEDTKLLVGVRQSYDPKLGKTHVAVDSVFGICTAFDTDEAPNAPRIMSVVLTPEA